MLRVDTEGKTASPIYTDDRSALTSAQFNPQNGRLYVTDFLGGAVRSMTANGQDAQEVFAGPVDGTPMQPDDISFDAAGNLFIADAAGARAPYWDASGRIIRVDGATAEAKALASGLESPNGVAFSPSNNAVWVSLNTGNRVDHLTLSKDGKSIAAAHPAIYASVGQAQVDSIAVDAEGNLYVGLHNRPEILIYDPNGQLLQTITLPAKDTAGLSSATNVAINPAPPRPTPPSVEPMGVFSTHSMLWQKGYDSPTAADDNSALAGSDWQAKPKSDRV
ncbi:sugar lactone lactonase YvrE [Pseudarthrobacter siccitolerans]|uniref:Sugar lactone lactonase YvrE n=1 Tax=Pseudarthrobacter siccitolerans TaxID=861266 RepID=A0ABU0PMA9_9MICC|nr:SMP-30/gluconolactonase/LRE family protein [Pseudarthrobacter siccitolerans]MDQ0675080.1 sugar lactone lactonase YvrE [Pseudarthrobacter siccitolerans]